MSIPNTPETTPAQTAAETQAAAQVPAPATADTTVLPPASAAPAQPAATSYTAEAPAAPAAPAPAPAAAPAAPAAESDSNTLSITSFVLGLCSIVLGWTFVAPAVGLVLGILARKREPRGRTFANWGIGLNAAMLALTVLALIALFVFAAIFLPFAIAASDSVYYVS